MPSPEFLALAQQGNPKVIAAILNHSLKPLGITARATTREQELHVVLHSSPAPDRQQSIALVDQLIQTLQLQNLQRVHIYAHQAYAKHIAWQHEISLRSPERAVEAASSSTQLRSPDSGYAASSPAQTIDELPPDLQNPFEHPSFLDTMDPTEWFEPSQPTPAQPEPEFQEADPVDVPTELAFAPTAVDADDNWMRRPEAAILVIFALLVGVWQLYLDLAEGDGSLSGVKLSKRLGVSPSTISRRKRLANFPVWSQTIDPDGISWRYRSGRFLPIIDMMEQPEVVEQL